MERRGTTAPLCITETAVSTECPACQHSILYLHAHAPDLILA